MYILHAVGRNYTQPLSPWVRKISHLTLGIEIARSSTMKSILIADGSEYVADLFADVFTWHAWAVTRYTNSQRAREALRGRAHYEAVLVGYRFDGGIDGVELINQVRGLDPRKETAVVMITGTGDIAVVAAALAAGADDVLYKPVDAGVVVAAVSNCLEGRRRFDV
jgi:DNA-binding NtrC family response regulator